MSRPPSVPGGADILGRIEAGADVARAITEAATLRPDMAGLRIGPVLSHQRRKTVIAAHLHDDKAVLIRFGGPQGRDRAHAHFTELLRVAPRFAGGDLRIMAPLRLWPDLALMAVGAVPGRPLDQRLPAMNPRQRARVMGAAGAWLSRYAGADARLQTLPVAERLEGARRRLARAENDDPQAARPLDLVADFADRQGDMAAPHGPVHGDFFPHNLYLKGPALWGIDSGDGQPDFLCMDVIRCLRGAQRLAPPDAPLDRFGFVAGDLAAMQPESADGNGVLTILNALNLFWLLLDTAPFAPARPALERALSAVTAGLRA